MLGSTETTTTNEQMHSYSSIYIPFTSINFPHPSEHLILDVQLLVGTTIIRTYAMLDSGAMSSFVDQTFVQNHKKLLCPRAKEKPFEVVAVDGRPIESGTINKEVEIELLIGKHSETIILDVTKLGHYPIILGIPWLKKHNPEISWSSHLVTFNSKSCHENCLPKSCLNSVIQGMFEHPIVPVSSVSVSSSQISKSPDDIVPPQYQKYKEVFSEKEADSLPKHGPFDHSIPIMEGENPPFGPIYPLSKVELNTLSEYLDENLKKGFIRKSSSPAGAPILFVKKKDGSLRLCVDYRGLNKITTKNRYPLPLINELLDRLATAKFYTKLDIRNAYHRIRIAEGEEWKTAFRTRYGLFEYLVMPFGLTNAPASFQNLINETLREYLDHFVVVYLDDILIFSSDLEQHRTHVSLVLDKLLGAGLYVKAEKCEFDATDVEFLGFRVGQNNVSMDPKKVSTIVEWPVPKDSHDVQVFLGFANFYRRFIASYSKLASPLTALLKKNTTFMWTSEANTSFEKLKEAFTSAPLLHIYDPSAPCVLETDASDFAISGVLNQKKNDQLCPVAFFSRKLNAAEVNYDIHDKELLAIVDSFKQWRHYLEGATHRVEVITDHKNLEYFMNSKRLTLNRRQARWAIELANYDFVIVYRPGSKNCRADALSRRTDLNFDEKGGKQPVKQILDQNTIPDLQNRYKQIASVTNASSDILYNSEFVQRVKNLYKNDSLATTILNFVKNPKSIPKALSKDFSHNFCRKDLQNFRIDPLTGLVLRYSAIYVPDDVQLKLDLLKQHHDSILSGHFGRSKTTELLSRSFWWPGLRLFVKRYIANCQICTRSKPSRQLPIGHLHPLPIPERPWASISMDFITGLPLSNQCNSILVVVDRLTKMSHFIACVDTLSAEELSSIFLNNIFRLHGLPTDIISDRGTLFTSRFWKELMKQLQIKTNFSTAFHPQTDGQTERVNSILEQYLRVYVNYLQDNWFSLLPLAEFCYNNSEQASIKKSPFFANYSFHPSLHLSPLKDSSVPASFDLVSNLQEIHENIKSEIFLAQQQQEKYYNQHRKPTPDYNINDFVFLSTKNIKTLRPSKKLDHRFIGPYKVLEKIGSHAYRLDLPSSIKIHPVFHVSLLLPAQNSSLPDFPNRVASPPPPVEVDGYEEWKVREIIDSRIHRGKLQYLVAWEGFPNSSDNSWEPEVNVRGNEFVNNFHLRYPSKPSLASVSSSPSRNSRKKPRKPC